MIHFTSGGRQDGEALLFCSGLGGAAGYWADNLAAFAPHYRLITYDQRGTGASPRDLEDPTGVDDMAADALQVLDRAGVRSCRIVGHALGGLIGLALAARAPARVSHLVVVNGFAAMHAHTERCFDTRLALLLHAGVNAYLRAQPLFLYPPRWMAANAARLAAEEAHAREAFSGARNTQLRIGALRRFDAGPLLSRLACRTLLISSEDDMLVPPVCSEQLRDSIPGARLARLDGGHACNVTDPAGFAALCLPFLP